MGLMRWMLPLLAAGAATAAADGFKAGVARVNITPPLPFRLSGYAARTNPATTVRTDLWAKALALDDGAGGRAVIVTADLIGFPRELSDSIADRVEKEHGLPRARLLLNTSHTHYGPAVRSNLSIMFNLEEWEREQFAAYGARLADDVVAMVGRALADLAPSELAFGRGAADFAINRREPSPAGIKLGRNPSGPVDHEVPVLRISAPDGRLRAVLFGYACHGTTMSSQFNEVDGDFGAWAQRAVEAAHPGATALYMILCGGDQNPDPRGEYEHMERHGRELADAVESALAGPLIPVRPPIRAARESIELDFAAHTREQFEREAATTNASATASAQRRRAHAMLTAYDRGEPMRRIPVQVQTIRFGDDLALLGLSGEVVVDYALRVKKEYAGRNLVVAGFCNDVSCYIPSLRVLREGGYEVESSMIFYGCPGPLAENVEETVFAAIRRVMSAAGITPASVAGAERP